MGNVASPGRILCEDDVIFQRSFLAELTNGSALKALSSVDGIVLLNYRSTAPIKAEKVPHRTFGRYSIHRVRSPTIASAAAYFMTPATAERVRSFQTPLQAPVDGWAEMKAAGAISDIYLVHPAPVSTGHFASTINYGRDSHSRTGQYMRNLRWLRRLRWALLRTRGSSHMSVTEWE
jgi:GR25 family glycosyltransferase involved in LPS biosynthesis